MGTPECGQHKSRDSSSMGPGEGTWSGRSSSDRGGAFLPLQGSVLLREAQTDREQGGR